MIDPIWWFLLFWIPDFLQRVQLKLMFSLTSGALPEAGFRPVMIHRERSVNVSRKVAMPVCALSVVPIVFAYRMESLWRSVLLIGLAAAGRQGFPANLFSLSSDVFPAQAVGSVVGIGGMAVQSVECLWRRLFDTSCAGIPLAPCPGPSP